MRYAFISRHGPTERQLDLAARKDIELVYVGDVNPFGIAPQFIAEHENGPFHGVVVVDPAVALRLCKAYPVGVFESVIRAPAGERRRLETVSLHIFDLR